MRRSLLLVLAVVAISCSSHQGVRNLPPTGTGEKISGKIFVNERSMFKDAGMIDVSIKNECTTIDTDMVKSVMKIGSEHGLKLETVKKQKNKGNYLVVQILNAFSSGNAFIGHNKQIMAQAKLYSNGKLVDSTKITRNSGGGFWGGFKSSCGVLQRVSNKIGEDIATWVKKYTK